MLKKIVACLCAVFVMLSVFTVSVSAVETSTSSSGAEHGGSEGKFGDDNTTTVNLWSSSMFHHFFGDRNINENGEYKKYADDIFKSDGKVVKDSFGLFHVGGDGQPNFSGMDIYVTDGEFVVENNNPANDPEHYVAVSCRNYTYIGALRLSVESSNKVFKIAYSDVISFPQRYFKNIIYKDVSNLDISKPVTAYQCSNVYQSFLDYLNAGQYNFTDIKLLDGYKNLIKFYDQFDSPKGNYGINYYETPMENYINSGVMFKDDVYYQNSKLDDDKKAFQISQLVDFYIIPNESTQQSFTNMRLFDFLDSNMSLNAVDDYLKNNSCALYYDESGILETSDWYTKHIVNGQSIVTNFATNFKLGYWKDKQQFYIKFTMPDAYSRLENADKTSVILTGCHTKHSCQAVNPKTGEEISAGFGKNINNADNAKRPSKKVLLDNGWQRGYPNTKGNYVYKMTLNVNGEEYLYVYFANMPSVSSNFFSDNCIQYGVNFYGTKGYFYDPVNNVSHEFDMTNFSTDETRDFNNKNYFGSASVKVRDPLDAVKDFLGSSSQSVTADFLGIDISEFSNTFTAYFWTNYTGSLSAGYKGYYVQFNWRLEGNEHFRKNNSDDTHNYDDDYKKDEAQKDNNGNTHGGAVENPTETPSYNGFNNSDFKFDENNLWNYATSFLNFCANAFLILPAFIWQLIACSIVIIIILRIAGR